MKKLFTLLFLFFITQNTYSQTVQFVENNDNCEDLIAVVVFDEDLSSQAVNTSPISTKYIHPTDGMTDEQIEKWYKKHQNLRWAVQKLQGIITQKIAEDPSVMDTEEYNNLTEQLNEKKRELAELLKR